MIDLHTHSILSDGDLLPSELVRRAQVNGVRAIAITDHVDHSNIEPVIAGLVKAVKILNRYWDIFVMPGVEITHVPVEAFKELVILARKKGAKIVVGHGESPVEPVIKGTNRAAIEAGVDILAHPGDIREEDAALAAARGVYLEISARRGHSLGNRHVFDTALKTGAKLVFDTDSHSPQDIMSEKIREEVLGGLAVPAGERERMFGNSEEIVERIKKR